MLSYFAALPVYDALGAMLGRGVFQDYKPSAAF